MSKRWDDDPPYGPGNEDYEYDSWRQKKDEREDELEQQRREHDAMVEEAFKVHHGLPVVRSFSDTDLEPHMFTIRVIDAFFNKILEG